VWLASDAQDGAPVREEQLRAANLVVGDRLLPQRRSQPFDETPTELLFDMRMDRRVHQHDAILIEQTAVLLDGNRQGPLIFEAEPGSKISGP
jgi:hypothetical protein